MNSMILLLFAALMLAGGAIAWALIQPEPIRVPLRRLPSPTGRKER